MKEKKVYQFLKDTSREDVYKYCLKVAYISMILGVLSLTVWTYSTFNETINFILWEIIKLFTSSLVGASIVLFSFGGLLLILGYIIEPSE